MFGERAARLAGLAGVLFGWSPDIFWAATPAELASLIAALAGDGGTAPPDATQLRALMEQFPDG
ncbi:phage tail assembly chaperone [Sphingomonas sp.]|uniref:phage tail assembly chaperone n=1 Tax=Sphingomonas sp. TaxID=28214 RepID=UPI001D1C55CB|nr:phage tail assembly chaperone [Sphingomonas sp.]MBX9796091.1 phage tail assembly chaperone [Sphingomonas sp.]